MSIVNYTNRPAPLPWDLVTAMYGKSSKGALHSASALETLQQFLSFPRSGAGDPVGLVVDQRLNLGPELWDDNLDPEITNDGGTSGHYNKHTREFSNTIAGTLDNARPRFVFGEFTSGKIYRVRLKFSGPLDAIRSFTLNTGSASAGQDYGGISGESIRAGGGSVDLFVQRTGSGSTGGTIRFTIWSNGTTVWSGLRLEEVSIREVLTNTILQPVTSQRPRLVRWPKTGRRNLLERTEEFENPYWNKPNVTLSPGSSPDSIIITATGANGNIYKTVNTGMPAGTVATNSVEIRRVSGTGGVELKSPANSVGLIDVTSEWKRFTRTAGQGSFGYFVIMLREAGDAIEIRRPQLEIGDPTPYQHARSAYDITEEGVEDVWFFQKDDDGTDNLTINLDPGEYTKIAVNSKNEMFTEANHVVSGPENILRDDGLAKSIYYRPDEPRTDRELSPNPGGPFVGITDWTTIAANLSVVDGALRITKTNTNGQARLTAIPAVVGKTYRYKATLKGRTSTSSVYLQIGSTGSGGSDIARLLFVTGSTPVEEPITIEGTFVAPSNEIHVSLYSALGTGNYDDWSEVSIREVDYTLPLPVFDVLRRQYEPEPVVKLLGDEPAGLALDFVTGKAYVRGGGKDQLPRDINGFLTYQSPSTKYVRNKQGVLVPGTTLRCDHDAEGNPLGLLIEGQRTNLSLWSEDITKWTGLGGSIVIPDATSAPDGTMTADKLVAPAATGRFTVYRLVNGIPLTAHGWSIRAKKAEFDALQLDLSAGFGTASWANFDLNNGTVGLKGPNIIEHGIKALGDGWFECYAVAAAPTNTSAYTHVGLIPNAHTSGYADRVTGDGTSGLYIWGAQLEAGAFPTSYIKTEGSQVTRAADIVSLATAMFPFAKGPGTFIADFRFPNYTPNIGRDPGMILFVGTQHHRVYLTTGSGVGRPMGSQVYDGVIARGGARPSTYDDLAVDTNHSAALSYDETTSRFALNGVLGIDGVSASVNLNFPDATLRIGSSTAGQYFNGHLRSLTYLPRMIPNAELIARTTP